VLLTKEAKVVAYTINDDCISCGVCEDECPVEAISEGEDKYVIDPELCTDCGSCADICPVDAPQPEED
jgi:ferredoxin